MPCSRRIRLLPSLALGLLLGAPLAAQALPDPLPPANPAPLGYCPPERLSAGPAAPQHVLNVFLPPGPAPVGGWPVVVTTGYGGGASVPPASALSRTGASAPLWNLVSAGIAVVHFGTPGLGGRRGLWYPPGHPSGRYESWKPVDDNPEKSAEWALQWVKVQTLYPFDLTRIGLRGSSGGAVLAIRTAMGPERARASGSAQVRASTRVAAILAIQPPTSAWALAQGPELTIPFPRHLEQAAQPGVPATQLDQTDPELQKDYSLMRVAFESAEARANNAQQALCLVYGDPVLRLGGAVAPFDLDASGFPIVHDAILQPTQHDSWFGYVFWKRLLELSGESTAFHRANSIFAMRDINALAPPLALHTRTFRGTVSGAAANRIGHDWLVARIGPRPLALRAALGGTPLPVRGASSALALLGASPDGARIELGLAGEPGASAWLLAGPALDAARPFAGAAWLDPRALVVPPRAVALAPDQAGWTHLVLALPPELSLASRGLVVQAWITHGSGPGARVRPSNGLLLALRR